MTREYALKNIKHNTGTYVEQDFFINKIFDEIESRTCESCRYWIRFSDKHELKECQAKNGCAITGKDFFCAGYEKK